MHWFDIAVVVIAALSVTIGAWRGLVRIAFSVGAVVAGLAAARFFQPAVARWLATSLSPAAANIAAYVLLFVSAMVAVGLLGRLVTQVLVLTDVNWINRLAGAGLGFIGGCLVAAAMYAAVAFLAPVGSSPLTGSILAPYVGEVTRTIQTVMPPEVRDFFRREKERLLGQLPPRTQ